MWSSREWKGRSECFRICYRFRVIGDGMQVPLQPPILEPSVHPSIAEREGWRKVLGPGFVPVWPSGIEVPEGCVLCDVLTSPKLSAQPFFHVAAPMIKTQNPAHLGPLL